MLFFEPLLLKCSEMKHSFGRKNSGQQDIDRQTGPVSACELTATLRATVLVSDSEFSGLWPLQLFCELREALLFLASQVTKLQSSRRV